MSLKQERKAPFKVFISSTYRDLKEERKKAYEAVGEVCEAIGMEKFLPEDETTLKVILRELKKSNIYIGIIGSRYGTIVPESQLKTVEGENYKNYEGLSYTHYEFRKAGEFGIPRAVFVLHCECRDEQTKKFLEEIDILKSYFDSVDELRDRIEKFLREKIPEWVLEGRLRIPGFYGRKEELRKLYNEITGEEEVCSVVNVYGVGGIGKTAFAEALLFLLSIKGFYVFEVRLEEGREATFNIPDNYKVGTLKIQNLKGLAKLLGIEESENIEDHIISWMEENKVVLFLDDFQEYESNLKDFINKAYKNLKFGKIIIATRAQANVSCHSYVRLTSLEENSCTEMIRKEFERFSFKPEERIVELIYKKTKGHPLAVKMLVSLISRHKLSFNDLDKFGIINDIQNEEEVKDFIKRVFLENVKEEEDLKVLSYLSLLKNGFNYNVLKAILKGLDDERYNWNNGDLYRNFLSKYIDHVLSYDISKEIFNFSHDMVKEAANSQIGNIEEAREEILKMLKGMEFNQISEEEKVLIYEDIIYQAQELRGEESELSNTIIEYYLKVLKVSKELTERYYTYAPLMTYEYGCKALAYAEKLEKWIEALEIVEHILYQSDELLLSKDEAEPFIKKAEEFFDKASQTDEDRARYHYAFALYAWAFYVLHVMYDPEGAKQALEKAFKIIGNEDKRLIKDEALWLRVYLRLLSIKADILRNDGKIDEANKIFNKENKLLEQYKCLLMEKFGEKFYYREKAHIMNDKYDLYFDIAESMNDLKRVEFYVRECIDYSSKGGDKILEVSARNVLALVKILQAKNLEDFEKKFKKEAIENLENSIKTAREIQSKSDELFAMINKIIFNLTLNRNDIVNFAKNVKNEAVKVPNIYIQATAELYLAYVLLTLNLNGEVYNLIHSAYKKLRDVRSTRRSLHLIARAVEVIADYRRRKMSLEVLLKYLDDISDCLYNENQRLSAWVLRNFVESIRKRGYVDEELLRFDGVKLLATL